jgi:hypothetical protein
MRELTFIYNKGLLTLEHHMARLGLIEGYKKIKEHYQAD